MLNFAAMKYGKGIQDIPVVNVPDVALIFEGGGMRASCTSAVAAKLIEEDINFGHVYGVSAGASNAVNYLSRDVPRTEASFTSYVDNPDHIGWHRLLQGQYFFDGPWIYEQAVTRYGDADEPMGFDWEMFCANPAEVHIEAFDVIAGQSVFWTKDDMADCADMMKKVRASSSLPGFMEPAHVDGRLYLDGGLSKNCGLCILPAIEDGFDRLFVVRTQPRGYRKKKQNPLVGMVTKRAFKTMPNAVERMEERWRGYNDLCDKLEKLEESGAAYVFYPDEMNVTNHTTNLEQLNASLAAGQEQARREVEAWKEWLGL